MTDPIKYMDIAEFQSAGFLQEANRQFFHPHGLALEVRRHADGSVALSGIWDYRDDPEGVIFEPVTQEMRDKRATVVAEYERHREARLRLLSGPIQPLDVQPHTHEQVERTSP